MVTLVTLVTTVPTPGGVSSPAPLILCLGDIKPKVNRTGISITLISLRSTFLLSSLDEGMLHDECRLQVNP